MKFVMLVFILPSILMLASCHSGHHGNSQHEPITQNLHADPIEPTEIMETVKEISPHHRHEYNQHRDQHSGHHGRLTRHGHHKRHRLHVIKDDVQDDDLQSPLHSNHRSSVAKPATPSHLVTEVIYPPELKSTGEEGDLSPPSPAHHQPTDRPHDHFQDSQDFFPLDEASPLEWPSMGVSEEVEGSGQSSAPTQHMFDNTHESTEVHSVLTGDISHSYEDGENSIDKDFITTAKEQYKKREPYKFHNVPITPTWLPPVTSSTGPGSTSPGGLEELYTGREEDLKAVVLSLQAQLKESKSTQATTRSIINVLEERQQASARDVTWLKDELKALRSEQRDDRQVIAALKTMVADAAWGVNDLKQDVHQLRLDISNMKNLQAEQNDTVLSVEEFVESSSETHARYTNAIRHLQSELLSVRTEMGRERNSMNRQLTLMQEKLLNIKPVLQAGQNEVLEEGKGKNRDRDRDKERDKDRDRNRTRGRGRGRGKSSQGLSSGNRIHSVPIPGSTEQSGDGSREGKFDSRSSTLEESKNTIGHDIEEIRRNEQAIKEGMDVFEQRFLRYDSELAKIYVMFYNLSLSMANMENKVLTNQQSLHQTELKDLQKSFMNFTNQVFHLEQWHMASKGFVNTSAQNEREISQISNILDNHSARLRNFEDVIRDYKSINQQNYLLFMSYLERINNTIQSSHQNFHAHRDKASGVFDDVSEQLDDMSNAITSHDNRLNRVEVNVLNASLSRCEKAHSDLTQNMKLSEVSRAVDGVSDKLNQHNIKINRLDKAVSQLFDMTEKQGDTVTTIMEQLSSLWEMVPDVKHLQREVTNFISQLPIDCDEVMKTTLYHPDGVYLIKPHQSPASVAVACQFTPQRVAWTILQRRQDGKESFARSWEEYKNGFGDPEKEYWIGNENLYYLTNQQKYTLRIEMWDIADKFYYAEYDTFRVENEEDSSFRLHIGDYRGNATDAMQYSNLMPFSTPDRDNDVSSTHCAKFYTAGWWYKHCHYGNLNGRYTVGVVWFNHDLDEWIQLKTAVMKIRPLVAGEVQSHELLEKAG